MFGSPGRLVRPGPGQAGGGRQEPTTARHGSVNRGALIGHRTSIGDYVTIQPGANSAGACPIGEAAYVGRGAVIVDHVEIGSHSVVGAGAVVIRDVPQNVLVVGVPSRVVKENVPGK